MQYPYFAYFGNILHTGYYCNELRPETRLHLVGPNQTKSETITEVCFTSLDITAHYSTVDMLSTVQYIVQYCALLSFTV